MVELKESDKAFYRLLETIAEYEPERWVSKEELLTMLEGYYERSEGTHDICADMNNSRLRLNQARVEGQIRHLVLLKSHKFKLAASVEEVKEYSKRNLINGLKLLKRYWQDVGVIKTNGQGQLIDYEGNVIEEESLEERFIDPFNFKGESL